MGGFTRLALLSLTAIALVACGGEPASPTPAPATQYRAPISQAGATQGPATVTGAPVPTLSPTPSRDSGGTPATPQPSPTEAKPGLVTAGVAVTGLPPTPVPTAAATPTQPPAETQAPTAREQPASPEKAAHPFVLPSAPRGDLVSLESYIGQKNVVLVFYRGFW